MMVTLKKMSTNYKCNIREVEDLTAATSDKLRAIPVLYCRLSDIADVWGGGKVP